MRSLDRAFAIARTQNKNLPAEYLGSTNGLIPGLYTPNSSDVLSNQDLATGR